MSNFSALTLSDDEGARVYAAWLPGTPKSLLFGVTEDRNAGDAVILTAQQVAALAEALQHRVFTRLEGLTVSRANRGDPYRDGAEIELVPAEDPKDPYPYKYSIFLETQDCATLVDFLKA